MSGDGPASMESGDPLAEADFHMAYGLYDQAADLVQLAMKREPQRRDLKLKLLEIYFVWGNKERFLDLARDLDTTRADAPAGEWDKVLIMGKQIAPGDALFAGSPSSSASDSLDMELHGSTGTLDLTIPAGDSAGPDMDLTESDTEIAPIDRSGIDFILDEPARGNDESTRAADDRNAAHQQRRRYDRRYARGHGRSTRPRSRYAARPRVARRGRGQ